MIDIVDGLRELIAEAKIPGMYTPDERQQFAIQWIGVLSPDRLTALLDEIERLRHPKIVVGSRKVWEAMGEIVSEDEIERLRKALEEEKKWNRTLEITARKDVEQARNEALEEAAKVAEAPIMGHVVMPQPLIAAAIRALKEKADD